jgi:hypothetical protein
MRQWLRSHLTYANVMVTVLAFIVLSGGTAVALSGSNTVFTDDIVDNDVRTADVRNDSLAGGGLGAVDLQPNSVGTSEVAANSLNGGDINESLLGIVPTANRARGVDALFGDGSDGDQTIASNTTLSRDTYYHNLTVNPGTTLNPGGFRIFVSGTLTFGNGAKIARDGDEANGTTPGAALGSGTLGGSGGGGAVSADGDSVVNSLGGNGGDAPPGNGGNATRPPAAGGGDRVFHQALSALSGRSLDSALVNGGAGGGGNFGSGGGGGGGVVVVAARAVVLSGSAAITADGGAGGVGSSGGGGGGVVVVITATPKPAAITLSAEGNPPGGQLDTPGFTAWLD